MAEDIFNGASTENETKCGGVPSGDHSVVFCNLRGFRATILSARSELDSNETRYESSYD
jgi:hypothetical protein